MLYKNILGCAVASLLLSGCLASPASQIGTQHNPDLQRKYDCQDIVNATSRVNTRLQQLGAYLDHRAEKDKIKAAAGILFFPLWFTIEGNEGPEAQEYAKLKGERDILQQRFNSLRCSDFYEFSQ